VKTIDPTRVAALLAIAVAMAPLDLWRVGRAARRGKARRESFVLARKHDQKTESSTAGEGRIEEFPAGSHRAAKRVAAAWLSSG
jgi:hypothetical protein